MPEVGSSGLTSGDGKEALAIAPILDSTNSDIDYYRHPRSGPNCRRAEGNVRRLQATCYFTSARKLGVGSVLMSACLDAVAAAPGVPAATPRIGGTWRVTCAVY
jgi:hypothetical protein